MQEIIITSISAFLITWLLTHIEIYTQFMDWIFEKLLTRFWKRPIVTWLLNQLYVLVGCHKCLSFWITLFWTWNILLAIGVAYVAHLSMTIENKK